MSKPRRTDQELMFLNLDGEDRKRGHELIFSKVVKNFDEIVLPTYRRVWDDFQLYKTDVGSLISAFYHSEVRFMHGFFESDFFKFLKTEWNPVHSRDINIFFHSYFRSCPNCKEFLKMCYEIIKSELNLAHLKILVSFNEDYNQNGKVTNIQSELFQPVDFDPGSMLDGIFYMRIS